MSVAREDAAVQRIMDRIDHATRMFHDAHNNWSSEEIEPGVSYLEWIKNAIHEELTNARQQDGLLSIQAALRRYADNIRLENATITDRQLDGLAREISVILSGKDDVPR